MAELSAKIDDFCNPFSDDAPTALVNVATGQIASKVTESYLVNALQRDQVKFTQYYNSRSAGSPECANFSTVRNIIRAKSFAM
jgi:hypothetical protein